MEWSIKRIEQIWNGRAMAIALCAAATLCICWLHWKLPLPGVAVAVLGAAAAVMSLRPKMKIFEKAAWMLMISGLLFAEIRAIRKDRKDANDQTLSDRKTQDANFQGIRTQQNIDFSQTATGLGTAINALDLTISENRTHFDKTISKVDRAINTETGGDTFIYLDIRTYLRDTIMLEAIRVGNYPIRDVAVSMTNLSKESELMTQLQEQLPRQTPQSETELMNTLQRVRTASESQFSIKAFATPKVDLALYLLSEEHANIFAFTFAGFTKTWQEDLSVRIVNGWWKEAVRVREEVSPNQYRILMAKADPDFPKDSEGRPDTPWKNDKSSLSTRQLK